MPKGLNAHLKTAVKGSTLILLGIAGSNLLWFLIKILIVRNTTKAEFGIYSLTLTIFAVLTTIAPLGVPSGVPRFISLYRGGGKEEEAKGISRAGVQISLAMGLLVFVILYVFSNTIARRVFYTPELAGPLKIVAFLVPFAIYANSVAGVMLGYNIVRQRFLNDLLTPLFYALFILAAILLKKHLTGVLYAYVFSGLIMSFLMMGYGIKKIGAAPILPGKGRERWELLKFSVPLLVSTVMAMILMWADTLMIGRYINPQAVGTYGVSASLAKLLLVPFTALNFVFLPIAGEIYAGGRAGELQRAYQVLTKWLFAVTLPIFFVLFFFPGMSITALFGARFLDAALPLRLLAIGLMINAFLGTNGMLLTVLGLPKTIMNVSIAGGVANVALNYIFIKRMGMGIAGGALATMISYILINVFCSLALYWRSGLHPFSPSYLKPLAGAAISGLLIYAVAKSLPLSYWMLPAYFLLFLAGYAGSLLLTKSIEGEDLFILGRVFDRLGMKPGRLMGFLKRFEKH